jgi:hypothetical protein
MVEVTTKNLKMIHLTPEQLKEAIRQYIIKSPTCEIPPIGAQMTFAPDGPMELVIVWEANT